MSERLENREEGVVPVQKDVGRHTPGPWRVDTPKQIGDYYAAGDAFRVSAETDGKWAVAGIFCSSPNAEANARLIAAAPELLEALRAVVAVRDKSAFAQARAAIRKATGA